MKEAKFKTDEIVFFIEDDNMYKGKIDMVMRQDDLFSGNPTYTYYITGARRAKAENKIFKTENALITYLKKNIKELY